jgi:hypothetical protein
MRKISYAITVVMLLACCDTAWAVMQETAVTITDNGKPIPDATVSLNLVTPTDKNKDKQEPPHPRTAKTDEHGNIVLEHDEGDKDSDAVVEVKIVTADGRTVSRRATLAGLLVGIPFDVSKNECADPRLFTDTQLRTLLSNPEMRTRITTLIDERNQSERKQKAGERLREKKKHKSRKTTARRRHNRDTDSPPRSDAASDAAAAIATDVIIGIGVNAIGRHGGGRHGGERRNEWRDGGGQHER